MTQPMPLPSLPCVPPPAAPHAEVALTLLGPSAAMAQLWTQIRRLAPYVRTVLLTGEADSGQEAVARLLLDLSPHNQRSFVSLVAEEAESRLLRPAGLVSFPSDVFLFLPDVHRLSLSAQDALVRMIRTRRARFFTVVAATTEDLRSLAAAGRFSRELCDLLAPVRIAIPALRERPEDVPMLLNQLLQLRCEALERAVPQAGEDFLRAAMAYTWPGNLRELVRTVSALCDDEPCPGLDASHLHRAILYRDASPASNQAAPVRLVSLDLVMQEHIFAVLSACRGNKLRAAEVLGISRSTLYRMLDSASVLTSSSLSMAS